MTVRIEMTASRKARQVTRRMAEKAATLALKTARKNRGRWN